MGKVLRVDGSSAEAYVFKQLGSLYPDVWLETDVYLPSAVVSLWTTGGAAAVLISLFKNGVGDVQDVFITDPGTYLNYWYGTVNPPEGGDTPSPASIANEFATFKVRHSNGVLSELFINGSQVWSVAPSVNDDIDQLFLGLVNLHPNGGPVFYDNVKVGTTEGAIDIFADDFEDGTLDAWTSTTGDVSIVDAPTAARRVFVDQTWRGFVTSIESRTLTILDGRVSDGTFMFPLDAPAVHSGSVPSDDPEINIAWPDADSPANLTNSRRLIYCLRREAGIPPYECRFGGIIMSVEDQGTDIPTTRYTAYDPWQYLMSRPVRNPYTGELPDQRTGLVFPAGSLASDIALLLLEATETVDGDTHVDLTDLSLVEDTEPLPADITFDAGLSVGEAWNQLVETGTIDIALPPIYDPIARPGKVCMFQCASMLGQVRFGAVMSWDRSIRTVMNLSRLVDGTRLANRVQWFGANGQAVALQSAGTSIAENGEYWAQQFFPDARDGDLLVLGALAQLLIRRNGERTVSLDVAPEAPELALRDYKPGDWVPVWASRNLREPLSVDYDAYLSDPDQPGAAGYMRIQAIPISLDNNGVETVPGLVLSKDGAGSGA